MGDVPLRLRPARAADVPRLAEIARAAYARYVERLGGREPRPMSEDYAGYDSIYLYTHERMTENIALYERIGYVEYDRRAHGRDANLLVYLRKPLR